MKTPTTRAAKINVLLRHKLIPSARFSNNIPMPPQFRGGGIYDQLAKPPELGVKAAERMRQFDPDMKKARALLQHLSKDLPKRKVHRRRR